jgi:hypothetical protein
MKRKLPRKPRNAKKTKKQTTTTKPKSKSRSPPKSPPVPATSQTSQIELAVQQLPALETAPKLVSLFDEKSSLETKEKQEKQNIEEDIKKFCNDFHFKEWKSWDERIIEPQLQQPIPEDHLRDAKQTLESMKMEIALLAQETTSPTSPKSNNKKMKKIEFIELHLLEENRKHAKVTDTICPCFLCSAFLYSVLCYLEQNKSQDPTLKPIDRENYRDGYILKWWVPSSGHDYNSLYGERESGIRADWLRKFYETSSCFSSAVLTHIFWTCMRDPKLADKIWKDVEESLEATAESLKRNLRSFRSIVNASALCQRELTHYKEYEFL